MEFLVIDNDWLASGGTAKAIESLVADARVYEAPTLKQGFAVLQQHPEVALVVLDLNLAESQGADTLRLFKEWRDANDSTTRVVVLSAAGRYNPDLVSEVLESYATGFVPKGTPFQKFRHALGHTLDGGIYVPDELLTGMSDTEEIGTARDVSTPQFTPRQHDVAHFLVQGLTNRQIAEQLQRLDGQPVAEETVRVHISKIAWKLRVEPRKLAVVSEIARRKLRFPLRKRKKT